ncbi:uncharacterized protein LOC133728801 [Rosa rugosa]|uniref:uncharacterized protein LOC133728801 n=1 Tax=Rosa rugosa TaxID=74645 RepID=UPI002B417A32|nr:uncharacterized protein LOC133728801 [Rosa rugosa]
MGDPVSDEMLHISSYGIRNTTMEKQISVDPISLNRELSDNPVQTVVTTPKPKGPNQLPPLLPPTNSKFLSLSLPSSAASSPRFGASLLKKKWKNERQVSPQQVEDVNHLHSASYNPLPLQQEQFRRTKSCGEGREYAPDDFDLWLIQPNAIEIVNKAYTNYTSFSKTEVNRAVHKNGKNNDPSDDIDEFKCGALCLYLPGFGSKAKPVRARKGESELQNQNVISRSVSLEKFECGSWASQVMVSGNLEDSMGHFDLPLELIRGNVNDAHSPVTTGFLFDKDIKGVLKNGSARTSAARKSYESPRHVRFSTSSPKSYPASPGSCITPRLRKAREDFNAFLEAQSA